MADGVLAPLTGTGDATAKVATDDTGATGHVQLFKLTISADGSVVVIPADAANGLDVDVTRAPARSRTVDAIAAALQTDAIMNGLTALTPKFAIIDGATSGDNALVAAVSSKKIRLVAAFLVSAAAVTVRFESGTGGTALTGQMNVAATGGFVLPFNPVGWFETAATTLLNMELSGATSCDGCLTYIEV